MPSGLGEGALWVLDPAAPKTEAVVPGGPKLVKIDLATNKAVQIIAFDQTIAPQRAAISLRFGGLIFKTPAETSSFSEGTWRARQLAPFRIGEVPVCQMRFSAPTLVETPSDFLFDLKLRGLLSPVICSRELTQRERKKGRERRE